MVDLMLIYIERCEASEFLVATMDTTNTGIPKKLDHPVNKTMVFSVGKQPHE